MLDLHNVPSLPSLVQVAVTKEDDFQCPFPTCDQRFETFAAVQRVDSAHHCLCASPRVSLAHTYVP